MTKKDIYEWLELLETQKLESAEQNHKDKVAHIREEIFCKYLIDEKAAMLEKLLMQSSKKLTTLLVFCENHGLTMNCETTELRNIRQYSDDCMLEYLFAPYQMKLHTPELVSERKRYQEEQTAIKSNYYTVNELVAGSKNCKEACSKLAELKFNLKKLELFVNDCVLRGTRPVDISVFNLSQQI